MPVPRKRSCSQCRRAKSRCSLTSPRCSRCSSRSLSCDYSDVFPRSRTSGLVSNSWEGEVLGLVPASEDAGLLRPGGQVSEKDMSFLGIENMSALQWDAEVNPNIHSRVSRQSPFVFDSADVVFDASNPFMQQSPESWSERPFTLATETQNTRSQRQSLFELLEDAPPVASQDAYVAELSKKLFMTQGSPWPSPTTLPSRMRNLLSRRPIEKMNLSMPANFLFSTIQSYPNMLSTPTFPPFVHQYFAGLNSELPEPLSNCMAFMGMFRQRTRASEPFVFRTLFMEAQRLHNEFHEFDEWMKLAAVQALTIYIILVASEKDRCPTLCVMLILAVVEIATVMRHWNDVSEKERKGNIDWEEWRFTESKRRTMILLWLLETLLDMNIGLYPSRSCTKLDQIPLPSSKRLWDASTNSEWEEAYKCYLSSRSSAEIPNIGDLRTAQRLDAVMTKTLEDDMRDWSSSADSFGGLIMMIIR